MMQRFVRYMATADRYRFFMGRQNNNSNKISIIADGYWKLTAYTENYYKKVMSGYVGGR